MCTVDQCEYAVCGHTISTTQTCKLFTKGEKRGTYKHATECPRYKVIKRNEPHKCMKLGEDYCVKPFENSGAKHNTQDSKKLEVAKIVEEEDSFKKAKIVKKFEAVRKPEIMETEKSKGIDWAKIAEKEALTKAKVANKSAMKPGSKSDTKKPEVMKKPEDIKKPRTTPNWAKVVEEEAAKKAAANIKIEGSKKVEEKVPTEKMSLIDFSDPDESLVVSLRNGNLVPSLPLVGCF